MTLINNKKILFAGDPHGKFDQVNTTVLKYRPEAVFLLGDYNLDFPLDEYLETTAAISKIFWIYGNHDFSRKHWFDNLFNSSSSQSIHLKVVEISGVRIAGLGGVFLSKIWYPPAASKWKNRSHFLKYQPSNIRKQGGLLKHRSAIWHDEFEQLKDVRADILVTHEAPSCHKYGFDVLDELASCMGVKKIIHGHHHKYYKDTISNGIAVYGVAMQGIVDLEGNNLLSSIGGLS